jgi:hypothetical protein
MTNQIRWALYRNRTQYTARQFMVSVFHNRYRVRQGLDRPYTGRPACLLGSLIRTVQRKIVKLADEAVANSQPSSDRIETSSAHSENPPPSSDRIETRSAYSKTSNTPTANKNTLAAQSNQSTYPLQPQIAVAEASQDVIQFFDTLGNDFEIPFISIRSWQVSFITGCPRLFLLLKLFRL